MLVRQCGRPNWGEGLRQGVAIFLMKKLTFGHFSGRPYGGVLYLGVWGAGSSGPPARARAVGSMKTIPGGGRSRLEPRMPTAACQRLGRQDLPSPARVGEEPAKPPTARLETATPASTQALGGPLAIGDGALGPMCSLLQVSDRSAPWLPGCAWRRKLVRGVGIEP